MNRRPSEVDLVLGRRLRDARFAVGLTQDQLAKSIGVRPDTVAKFETGQRHLSPRRLCHVAEVLERPLSYFFMDEPCVATGLGLDALFQKRFEILRPLVRLWAERRGRMPDDFVHFIGRSSLSPRTVLLRQVSRSAELIHEHVPTGVPYMTPCQWLQLIGRDVEELPDESYGAWAKKAYLDVLSVGAPRLDSVRAATRTITGATVEARYDRLVLPWRRTGLDFFVSVVSIRREISIAPPAHSEAL